MWFWYWISATSTGITKLSPCLQFSFNFSSLAQILWVIVVWFHVTSPKKIIISNGGFIISVMDDPMQNTEAEAEDGITDRNNDL